MRHFFFYIFLFCSLTMNNLQAQVNSNNLFHKTWKTKSYGVKFLTKTFNIYNKDSINNPLDYINKTFVFSETGTYIGKDVKNDSIYHGKWSINSKGDSITLDGKRKYLNLLDADNLITSLSYLQYADTSGKVDTVVYYLHLYSVPDITTVGHSDDNSFFTLYPNPTAGNFKILFVGEGKDISSVRVTNMLGQPVAEQAVPANAKETEMDVHHLNAGIYFIEVRDKKSSVLGKKHFIKQ